MSCVSSELDTSYYDAVCPYSFNIANGGEGGTAWQSFRSITIVEQFCMVCCPAGGIPGVKIV